MVDCNKAVRTVTCGQPLAPEIARYLELMGERPRLFADSDELPLVTNPAEMGAFSQESGCRVGVVYESRFNMLLVDVVRDRSGKMFAYERMVPATEAPGVVMVPVADGHLVLIESYRHAPRTAQWAFPRGFAEPGLTPEENASKELGEELGARVACVEQLGAVSPDSGLTSNRPEVYACVLESYRASVGYEGIRRSVGLTEREFEAWVADGRLDDGYTLAAYCLYKARRSALNVGSFRP